MGTSTLSEASKNLSPRTRGLRPTVSVCPYCAVGCSQVVYHRGNRVLSIEGNPDSPINRGTLCPKGAATSSLIDSPLRWRTVRYRAPYSDRWEDRPLDWAMDRIAERVATTREATFVERGEDGCALNHTLAIGHLGGATLDNEENYLIKKLWTGLGIVQVENQARI
ncbi:MAG: dehydrogenase [Chloroflexota bacterium]|nr:MAG: dehydrogenase [Chloroflexota bacterium]